MPSIYQNALAGINEVFRQADELEKEFHTAEEMLRQSEATLARAQNIGGLPIGEEEHRIAREAFEKGDYKTAASVAEKNSAELLALYDETEETIQAFDTEIAEAEKSIANASFKPVLEKAIELLERRQLANAIDTANEGRQKLEQVLTEWEPELAGAFSEGLVAGEWNQATISLNNEGLAHANEVTITLEGIKTRGDFTTPRVNAGQTVEIVGALLPSDPGKVPLNLTVVARRAIDGNEYRFKSEVWVVVQRPGTTVADRPTRAVKIPKKVPRKRVEPTWKPPVGLAGDAEILAEFFTKRWEAYREFPENQLILDFLHNSRKRFAISSYFEIPVDPGKVLHDWALPANLRGNVYLDDVRRQHLETIIESGFAKNYVIIGEPGVGKTVLLYEALDRLMARQPVGLLTTPNLGDAHQRFGIRQFYDDIPENLALVEAVAGKKVRGLIVSSREADWKNLPAKFREQFNRLTVPLFAPEEMEQLCRKVLDVNGIRYDGAAIGLLVRYAQGSPIYVGSLVREMTYSSARLLTPTYLKENARKGMVDYVAMILQRLLKDGREYRPGALHALGCLIFLADYTAERRCHEFLFRAFADEIDDPMDEKLGDGQDLTTFNQTIAYLSGEGSLIRFPHDTWVDVLQGTGARNPFRAEIQMIRKEFEDTGRFEALKKSAIAEAWSMMAKRYRKNAVRQKDSFLALADTLTNNFRLSDLKEMGVDVDMVREVASANSDDPVAAIIISRIAGAEPQGVTNVINIQDSVISRSTIGAGGAADVEDSIVHRSGGNG